MNVADLKHKCFLLKGVVFYFFAHILYLCLYCAQSALEKYSEPLNIFHILFIHNLSVQCFT